MKRLFLALPLAFVVSASLFYFMAWMVSSQNGKLEESKPSVMFDFVMQEPEANVQRRQRELPEPPKLPDHIPLPTSTPNVAKAQVPQTLTVPQTGSGQFRCGGMYTQTTSKCRIQSFIFCPISSSKNLERTRHSAAFFP
jgi:hypothetical protein